MKKKNLLVGVAAMAAVAVVSVGGTLAYLTQQTEQVTNVFASDVHLKGKIEETFDEESAQRYLPGEAIKKEVSLLLKKGSADAYAALKVTVEGNDGKEIPFDVFEQKYGKLQIKDGTKLVDGYNTNAWTEVKTNGDERFFLYGSSSGLTILQAKSSDATTPTLFDAVKIDAQIKQVVNEKYKTTKVYKQKADGGYVLVDSSTISTGQNETLYQKEGDNWVEIDDLEVYPKFNVVVKGYMVQADNISYEDAKAALAEQAKVVLK